jgi:hypothetical protein
MRFLEYIWQLKYFYTSTTSQDLKHVIGDVLSFKYCIIYRSQLFPSCRVLVMLGAVYSCDFANEYLYDYVYDFLQKMAFTIFLLKSVVK